MLRRRSAVRDLIRRKLPVALLMAVVIPAGISLGLPASTITLVIIISYCVIFFFSTFGLATLALAFATVCSVAFLFGRS